MVGQLLLLEVDFHPFVICQLVLCKVGYNPYLILPLILMHLHFIQDLLIGFNLLILGWPDLPRIVIGTWISRLRASCSLYQTGLTDHLIVERWVCFNHWKYGMIVWMTEMIFGRISVRTFIFIDVQDSIIIWWPFLTKSCWSLFLKVPSGVAIRSPSIAVSVGLVQGCYYTLMILFVRP